MPKGKCRQSFGLNPNPGQMAEPRPTLLRLHAASSSDPTKGWRLDMSPHSAALHIDPSYCHYTPAGAVGIRKPHHRALQARHRTGSPVPSNIRSRVQCRTTLDIDVTALGLTSSLETPVR